MKHLIMPWKVLLVLSFVITFIALVEAGIGVAIENGVVVANDVTCTATVAKLDGKIGLNLDCGGKKAQTSKVKFVLAYLQKPGPIICAVVRKGGGADGCKLKEDRG